MPMATSARPEGAVEIVLRDKMRIRVFGAFDPAVLRRAIDALGDR